MAHKVHGMVACFICTQGITHAHPLATPLSDWSFPAV